MTRVILNGRFLSAPQTGVQRAAANLITGLDRLLAESGGVRGGGWEVRAPRGPKHALALSAMALRDRSRLRGQAWEQFELPLAAGRGGLVNLCNAGPLMAPSAVSMIHDAQVYLAPQSYSPAFRRWYRAALPRLAARSRVVVTVSEFSRNMLARFGVAPLERIEVVPNGVDHMLDAPPAPEALRRLGVEPGGFVFAFGSLQAHKNLGVLLTAFADPALRDLKLVMSGGFDRGELHRAFGVEPGPNVIVAGRLTDGEIRALLEDAACLACPSTTEGFGLPPLEAMILGCPAVVAPAGALPEVCGAEALYAPVDDPGAWVAAIRTLADERDGRPARADRLRAHALRFSWRRSAQRLRDLIEAQV